MTELVDVDVALTCDLERAGTGSSESPCAGRATRPRPGGAGSQKSSDKSCSCSRAAVRSEPIRPGSIRRCTRRGSSLTGSSERRLVRSMPALIAGNERENRVAALRRVLATHGAQVHLARVVGAWPRFVQSASYLTTLTAGLPGFFVPNPLAFLGPHVHLGAEQRRLLFNMAPLRETISELVDFALNA